MGLMDKAKQAVKDADEKLGDKIDLDKLDSKIREEERKIEKYTKEIGDRVLEKFENGTVITKAEFDDIIDKIAACKDTIKKFEQDKEDIKSK